MNLFLSLALAALACNLPGGQPTETPTPSPAAATATLATASPAATACIATASRDANMRTGPGTDWEIIGQITAGNSAPVTGHNGSRTWLQINGTAWVSADLLTTTGDCSGILVAGFPPAPTKKSNNNSSQPQSTQPPSGSPSNTPTFSFPAVTLVVSNLAFSIDFSTSFNCGTSPRLSFIMYNQGNVNIESVYYSVEYPTGNYINAGTVNNAPFKNTATETQPGCTQPGAESLTPGQGKYIPMVVTSIPPAEAFLYIEACTQNNRGGTCESQVLFFSP